MNPFKSLFLILFLILAIPNIFAQNAAKQLLEEASNKYLKSNTVYIEYQLNKGPNNKFKGKLYLMGEKYSLLSNENQQIFDGKKLYTILNDEKEITVSNPKKESLTNPTRVLELYKTGYNYQIIKSSENITYIRLSPINKEDKTHIEVGINKKTKELKQVKEYNQHKEVSNILITKYMRNIKVPTSTFTFNKNRYKDYYITQLN